MNLGRDALVNNFELDDLQIVDGPPMRGTRTVVYSVCSTMDVSGAAFIVFDDAASEAVTRESSGVITFRSNYPLAGSIASELRSTLKTVRVHNLHHMRERSSVPPEMMASGAGGLMASPVFAPDNKAIGMLTALEHLPRLWTERDVKQLEDFAHLISQEIMLRASFATLGIMAREISNFRM